MAKGFKHGAGGGTSLNFKVVGGTTEPSNPAENTIWVNTDTDIPAWAFSAETAVFPSLGKTVTWDGDMEGLFSYLLNPGDGFNMYMVKISDHVFTMEELLNGFTIRKSNGTAVTVPAAEASDKVVEDGTTALVVADEVFIYLSATDGVEAGVYVFRTVYDDSAMEELIGNSFITEFTVNGEVPEGAVWIQTGAINAVAFNALKKNGVQVYPMSAKQYVDGAWVSKTAKSYQGGAWVDWIIYVYNNGDECVNVTGGWTTSPVTGATKFNTTITKDTSSMSLTTKGHWYSGYIHTANQIDVSAKSKLVCSFESASLPSDYSSFKFGLINTFAHTDTVDMPAYQIVTSKTVPTTVTVDISAVTGEYYVGFALCSGDGSSSTAKINGITSITLE